MTTRQKHQTNSEASLVSGGLHYYNKSSLTCQDIKIKRLPLLFLSPLTLAAFAANSVLCRMALRDLDNDALSFAMMRLFAGAIVLGAFLFRQGPLRPATWILRLGGPATLFGYAVCFSLAYVQMSSGTGALLLFGSVQMTMIISAVMRGQVLAGHEKLGILIAFGGLLYLLLPGLGMPEPWAAAWMILAGIFWGFYSLLGQKSGDPVFGTAWNFLFTIPLVALLALLYPFHLSHRGMALAVASGALTSGLGYVLWYRLLKQLKTSTAAVLQLCVPALAALGGVLILGEDLHLRLVVASLVIVGGILIKVKPFGVSPQSTRF